MRDLLCWQLSKLGLGCLGLTGAYDLPLDDEAGRHAVHQAAVLLELQLVRLGEHLLGAALELCASSVSEVAAREVKSDKRTLAEICRPYRPGPPRMTLAL